MGMHRALTALFLVVFISHSHQDRTELGLTVKELKKAGCTVWTDSQLVPGQRWPHQLESKILSSDIILVLVTPNSHKSYWVTAEILFSLDHHKPVVPLRPNPDTEMPLILEGLAEAHTSQLGEELGCGLSYARIAF